MVDEGYGLEPSLYIFSSDNDFACKTVEDLASMMKVLAISLSTAFFLLVISLIFFAFRVKEPQGSKLDSDNFISARNSQIDNDWIESLPQEWEFGYYLDHQK